MKKLSLLLSYFLVILFALDASAQAGWHWQNPYLQGNNLNCIIMNGAVGWAVGDLGTVMHTTNEGYDWEVVNIGTTETLTSIYLDAISGNGWIVGYNGTIFYTDNGGETWSKQNGGTHERLSGVSAIGGDCPWICGDNVILKSYNHGETWEWINSGIHTIFYAIDQIDCDEIWIAGKEGLVMHTSDAGLTWHSHPTPTSYSLFSIDLVENDDYRACGQMAVIIKSSDGGSTWVKENEISLQELYDVDTKGIVGPAYAVGRDGLILENLNGENWTQKESPTINTLNNVCFQALYDAVYICGWYGMILRKDDTPDSKFEIMNKQPVLYIASVEFINENEGWAVGGDKVEHSGTREGIILHTTDGGVTWEEQLNIPLVMSGLDFINENEGWATGDKGTIKHTTNGGQSWVTQDCPIWGMVNSVHFVDENNGWAVSTDNWGEIAHTSDGGNTWTLQASPTLNPLNDVFFVNVNEGWIVGMDSTMLHTTDGGQTWVKCHLDVTNNHYFRSVYFLDELLGWVVGVNGVVMLTKDGGISWQEIDTDYYNLLQSVFFIDSENGWAVGTDGNIIRSIDGGYTWFEQYSGVSSNYLLSVQFVNKMVGWATGEGGTIIKTENGGFWNEPGTFLRNKLNLPIHDLTETRDTLVVDVTEMRESGYQLVGLEVMLDSIIHNRASDLDINLTHNGTSVTLAKQVTDQGPNFLWTKLTDNASKIITNGVAPFSGNHKPFSPLNTFNGMDPNGEWILTVYDSKTGQTGTLKAWGIKPMFEKIVSVNEPIASEAEPKIEFLQTIPNPFTGKIQIKWKSNEGGYTSLKIYAINGQEITHLVDNYLPEGEYNIEFDGKFLNPGVYLCRFTFSDFITVKKIIKL